MKSAGGKEEQNSKRTILEETGKCGKTWSEVNGSAGNREKWSCFIFLMDHITYLI